MEIFDHTLLLRYIESTYTIVPCTPLYTLLSETYFYFSVCHFYTSYIEKYSNAVLCFVYWVKILIWEKCTGNYTWLYVFGYSKSGAKVYAQMENWLRVYSMRNFVHSPPTARRKEKWLRTCVRSQLFSWACLIVID